MSQEALGIPSGLEGLEPEYDLVIVGCGLSGGVIAERASKELGLKSLILDKRDHIGGNCFDFIDEHGFRISRYDLVCCYCDRVDTILVSKRHYTVVSSDPYGCLCAITY